MTGTGASSGTAAIDPDIGTLVSGFFLFLIAALNVVILAGIIKVFREMRSGAYDDQQLEEQLNRRGMMNRFLGPLARRIDTPWKMYPIGFLFGLGFDTATEVALLVLAGTAVVGGLPFYAVLSLPILFAAGMSLFDTADGCFMNFAYDWAFARPVGRSEPPETSRCRCDQPAPAAAGPVARDGSASCSSVIQLVSPYPPGSYSTRVSACRDMRVRCAPESARSLPPVKRTRGSERPAWLCCVTLRSEHQRGWRPPAPRPRYR